MAGARPIPPESEIRAIVGHTFPGGVYTVAHWENFLLTECTGADLLADGMVHPVVLFHMPILGCGATIAKMFALGQAESDFSIGIESYDWEMFSPLREEVAFNLRREATDRGVDSTRLVFGTHLPAPEYLASRARCARHFRPPPEARRAAARRRWK